MKARASRGWTAWARLIVRHRFVAAAVAAASCSRLLIIPVFSLKIGQAEHRLAGPQRPARTTPCRP